VPHHGCDKTKQSCRGGRKRREGNGGGRRDADLRHVTPPRTNASARGRGAGVKGPQGTRSAGRQKDFNNPLPLGQAWKEEGAGENGNTDSRKDGLSLQARSSTLGAWTIAGTSPIDPSSGRTPRSSARRQGCGRAREEIDVMKPAPAEPPQPRKGPESKAATANKGKARARGMATRSEYCRSGLRFGQLIWYGNGVKKILHQSDNTDRVPPSFLAHARTRRFARRESKRRRTSVCCSHRFPSDSTLLRPPPRVESLAVFDLR
jgi:hypothetical protein